MLRAKTSSLVNRTRVQALEAIRRKNRKKLLIPAEVVKAAEDENSPLHMCFEWDDTRAAHEYRIEQARHLIHMSVQVMETKKGEMTMAAYVSLPRDRKQPSGGYRSLAEVLTQKDLRRELVQTAVREFKAVKERYQRMEELVELQPIYREIDSLAEKFELKERAA